jgi:hypothetical protein
MAAQVDVISSCEYEGTENGVAYPSLSIFEQHMRDNAYFTTRGINFFSYFVHDFVASSNKCNAIAILCK